MHNFLPTSCHGSVRLRTLISCKDMFSSTITYIIFNAISIFESKIYKCIYFVLGIINSEGKLWKDQRRFLHDKLRQFGMTYMGNGKKLMERRIMVSLVDLNKMLKLYLRHLLQWKFLILINY